MQLTKFSIRNWYKFREIQVIQFINKTKEKTTTNLKQLMNKQIQGKPQLFFCNRDVQASLHTPQLIPLGTRYLPHPTSSSVV